MHQVSQPKEPGPILTLNGYSFFQQQVQQRLVTENLVQNGGALNATLPNPAIIALHQETHEEFSVTKIPKAQLNAQKYSIIANELKIGQHLRTLPNVRILCDVIDYQDHLFLFYSSPSAYLDNDSCDPKKKLQPISRQPGNSSTGSGVEITLLDYLKEVKAVNEEEGKVIFGQLIQILMGCHERQVAHRDLKLPSVLINPVTKAVRIADFSQATLIEKPNMLFSDRKGSPAYVAPEIIIGKPYHPFAPDYWAAGVILYALLTGTFPFMDSTPKQLFEKILQNNFTPFPSHLASSSCCNLIRGLLRPDQNTRFGANQVLTHDWLKMHNNHDDNQNHHNNSDNACHSGSEMEEDDQVVPDFD